MIIRKVFNNTYTVAGKPRQWYVIEGTPYKPFWDMPSMREIIGRSCSGIYGFTDRALAMAWIKSQNDRLERNAPRESRDAPFLVFGDPYGPIPVPYFR